MTADAAPAVRLTGICKRFGAVAANQDVHLCVGAGTVHGIVGENGAGKSTLMSVLYGFYEADAGRIEIDGREQRIRNARDALAAGIGMVHQHFMLVDSFDAVDNVLLGAEPAFSLTASRATARAGLQALMRDTGLQVRLDRPVEALPVGERQRLEILKALYRGARILILDEPTAVLTPQETEQLFVTLGRLRERGTTVLLITHKLKEILALCDAVTVMRGGRVVLDAPIAEVSLDRLAEAMVGRRVKTGRAAAVAAAQALAGPGASLGSHASAPPAAPGAAVTSAAPDAALTSGASGAPGAAGTGPAPQLLLRAEGLVWRDPLGVPRVDGVSLALRAGEIVGVAGVSGNGQSELLDLLSGLLAPDAGTLHLGGERFDAGRWLDPRSARRLRLAHVPEDRHRRGLVLPFEMWESAVLGYQDAPRYGRSLWMRRSRMRQDTAEMMADYDVRPREPGLRSALFSGGNQQKLVLAREARPEPQVLLVGQPTRGVDIGAIEFIHSQLRAMRERGGAVLVVSSELDEILALADRVVVMNAGRISGERPIDACDEATLGRLMAGDAADAALLAHPEVLSADLPSGAPAARSPERSA